MKRQQKCDWDWKSHVEPLMGLRLIDPWRVEEEFLPLDDVSEAHLLVSENHHNV